MTQAPQQLQGPAPVPQQPVQPPVYQAPAALPNAPGATASLVLGIIGLPLSGLVILILSVVSTPT